VTGCLLLHQASTRCHQAPPSSLLCRPLAPPTVEAAPPPSHFTSNPSPIPRWSPKASIGRGLIKPHHHPRQSQNPNLEAPPSQPTLIRPAPLHASGSTTTSGMCPSFLVAHAPAPPHWAFNTKIPDLKKEGPERRQWLPTRCKCQHFRLIGCGICWAHISALMQKTKEGNNSVAVPENDNVPANKSLGPLDPCQPHFW
jgi:hypothetical protein